MDVRRENTDVREVGFHPLPCPIHTTTTTTTPKAAKMYAHKEKVASEAAKGKATAATNAQLNKSSSIPTTREY